MDDRQRLTPLAGYGTRKRVPLGSLYIWCPVPPEFTAVGFVTMLLEQSSVSLTPGTIFGANGEGFVRISLSAPTEKIEEAMQRMTHLMQKSGGQIG